jgi:VanZ family protein
MAIFTVSSFTVGSSSDFYWKDFVVKKTAHVIEYGILATLIYRALINSNVSNKKAMLYSVALAFLYGATDEFHQSFTPGRGPKFTDVLIDTFGASLFIFGIIANIKKMPENIKQLFSKIQIIQY